MGLKPRESLGHGFLKCNVPLAAHWMLDTPGAHLYKRLSFGQTVTQR